MLISIQNYRVYLASAKKLTHYLALLCLDDEKLKEELSSMGVPNTESFNSSILAHINLSIPLLENMLSENNSGEKNTLDFDVDSVTSMSTSISSHEVALLGPPQEEKKCHIMVTVGREALSNEALVTDLLKTGTDVIRINCAHDDPTVWKEIITMTKNSSQMLKKPCRILMDLAGPKLRTGRVTKEASVMKITPKMNDYGEMISPSLIWICSSASTPLPPHLSMDAILCVEKELLKDIEVGDTLTLIDARGNKRSIKVRMMEHVNTANCGFVGECSRTAFVKLGTKLYLKKKNRKTSVGRVVKMPTSEPFIMLNTGDLLTIFRKSCLPTEGLATVKFDSAWITCSSDHIFNAVKVGEPIAFDDGKIWGKVQEKNANEITVSITRANPLGSRLGSGKSINIPESEVQFKGLTEKDFTDLDFVATHADMVGLSFLRDVNDLITVQHELERRKLSRLGVVLKIETREAFENLPHLLFQAMRFSNPLGVMIARGDLMVECGWSEMASIQEDIMELCRAANIPVIWATQVLESLIKFGFPTRAEITDMASGIRYVE